MKAITLASFDDRWMDGYLFCRKVYLWLDQMKKRPSGLSRIRGRESEQERKLIQELLPLAKFIRIKYRPGNSVRIKWKNGNQQFDAMIRQKGFLIKSSQRAPNHFVEVTCAEHPNEYMARELSAADKGRSGVEGLYRDKKTGVVISTPTVHSRYEHVDRFVEIVSSRITEKASKNYPANTVLIVACELSTYFERCEFEYLEQLVRAKHRDHPFQEILIFDSKYEAYDFSMTNA